MIPTFLGISLENTAGGKGHSKRIICQHSHQRNNTKRISLRDRSRSRQVPRVTNRYTRASYKAPIMSQLTVASMNLCCKLPQGVLLVSSKHKHHTHHHGNCSADRQWPRPHETAHASPAQGGPNHSVPENLPQDEHNQQRKKWFRAAAYAPIQGSEPTSSSTREGTWANTSRTHSDI